jgi:hypothetical protein
VLWGDSWAYKQFEIIGMFSFLENADQTTRCYGPL